MIELINLEKRYSTRSGEIVALKNINLKIGDGEIFGIVGASGAGKSTLVRCVNLLERPTNGRVLIDGEDLTAASPARLLEIRRNIGMIFQRFNLFEQRTVAGNVRFPLTLSKKFDRARADERVRELLGLVGLTEKAEAYPSELSGGQKQRAAIARALATSPKYLLCDEATSALDPETTDSILSLLMKVNRELGVTIVVITHEMKVVEKICTQVAVLGDSEIVECGTVSNVFTDPKSDVARRLIFPDLIKATAQDGNDVKLRLIFNGEGTEKPIISALALDLGLAVNILYADAKLYGDKPYGRMVIAFPDENENYRRVTSYLAENGVAFKKEA